MSTRMRSQSIYQATAGQPGFGNALKSAATQLATTNDLVTVTDQPLLFDTNGFAKNANIMSKDMKGLDIGFTNFDLASLFLVNEHGKPKAHIQLSDKDQKDLLAIHEAVGDAIKRKWSNYAVSLRDPLFNGGMDIGYPMIYDKAVGARVPKLITVLSDINGSGKRMREQVSLERLNDLLRGTVPTAIHGELNIWCKLTGADLPNNVVGGGYYFTVKEVHF